MQKKINIKNKKLKTSILIKKNFISDFIVNNDNDKSQALEKIKSELKLYEN